MTVWLDAQLSPSLANWIANTFGIQALAVKDIGLRDAKDPEIFARAREAGVVVMTKDKDFVDLLHRLGPPPKVIWITAGNTSNTAMKVVLSRSLVSALEILDRNEPLVEITR